MDPSFVMMSLTQLPPLYGPITHYFLRGIKMRTMVDTLHRHTALDDMDLGLGLSPEPMPYQTFLPPGVIRRAYSPVYLGGIEGTEIPVNNTNKPSNIVVRTDSYPWDNARPSERMSQKERLQIEMVYLTKLRDLRQRSELWPHRASVDLMMAGKKIDFDERFDLNKELRKLKSLILPDVARELLHGRGVRLPKNHASMKPRHIEVSPFLTQSAPLADHFAIDPDIRRANRVNKAHLYNVDDDPPAGLLPKIDRPTNQALPTSASSVSLQNVRRHTKGSRNFKLPPIVDETSDVGKTKVPSTKYLKVSVTKAPVEVARSSAATNSTFGKSGMSLRNSSLLRSETDKTSSVSTKDTLSDAGITPRTVDNKTVSLVLFIETPRSDTTLAPSIEPVVSKPTPGSQRPCTPNPLQRTGVEKSLAEQEKKELVNTFRRLDTDMDGHLLFNEMKTQLPPELSIYQERYLKQVYDVTSSYTFFGIEEFMSMNRLIKSVTNISDAVHDFYKLLKFDAALKETLKSYVSCFEKEDRRHHGNISFDAMKTVLMATLQIDRGQIDRLWSSMIEVINPSSLDVNKLDFLCWIPYFLTLHNR